MARETWVQSQVESYQRLKKWYLMPPCLTLSIIRYGSRVKWSNPGKGVAPFPTPWCSSYRKGSLRVTLDYGRQLHFFYLYIYIYMCVCVCVSEISWFALFFSFSGRCIWRQIFAWTEKEEQIKDPIRIHLLKRTKKTGSNMISVINFFLVPRPRYFTKRRKKRIS